MSELLPPAPWPDRDPLARRIAHPGALALAAADLDHRRGALLVRRGKGRTAARGGIDAWGWQELQPWLELRIELPVGPLFCIITGPTRGRHWSSAAARADLRRTAVAAGARRRFAPHQLRHAHAARSGSRCERLRFGAEGGG